MFNKQGQNLKTRRESAGEKQSDVLEYINTALNRSGQDAYKLNSRCVVSGWEHGKPIPYDVLEVLCEHYMTTMEDFSKADLEPFDIDNYDLSIVLYHLDDIFPVVGPDDYSPENCENLHFRNASEVHCHLIDTFIKMFCFSLDESPDVNPGVDYDVDPEKIADEYIRANHMKDKYAPYAFANRLSLLFLQSAFFVMANQALKLPLSLIGNKSDEEKILHPRRSEAINLMDAIRTFYPTIKKRGIQETIKRLVDQLYKVDEFREIADYYNAFSYLLGLVENNDDFMRNVKTGSILMESYARSGNTRAQYFLAIMAAASEKSASKF